MDTTTKPGATLTVTRHRSNLNSNQLDVLLALYRFRFATTSLLADYEQVSRQYMNTRLQILADQSYIARRYEARYKLAGRPASYHLLPKGLALLKTQPNISPAVLRKLAHDAKATDRFASHCINIFDLYTRLTSLYKGSFKLFTASYLEGFDTFPSPLPDAFISLAKTNTNYLVECFDGTKPDFIMKKRIEQLVDHADSGEWTASDEYPHILLVCTLPHVQFKAGKWTKRAVHDSWTNDLRISILSAQNPILPK